MEPNSKTRPNNNILEIVGLAICSIWLIVDILVLHLAGNLIFWGMAIIEVGTGTLFSKINERFRKGNRRSLSNLAMMPLAIIGVGAPIVIN